MLRSLFFSSLSLAFILSGQAFANQNNDVVCSATVLDLGSLEQVPIELHEATEEDQIMVKSIWRSHLSKTAKVVLVGEQRFSGKESDRGIKLGIIADRVTVTKKDHLALQVVTYRLEEPTSSTLGDGHIVPGDAPLLIEDAFTGILQPYTFEDWWKNKPRDSYKNYHTYKIQCRYAD